jgi:hypothetical protein
MLSLAGAELRNLQIHSRDLSVGQRRIWGGALPDRFRESCLIVSTLFHKLGDSVNVPFDLRCDVLRVQFRRRYVTISRRLSSVVKIVKELADVG